MQQDTAIKILQKLDEVECEMRHLEGRLTAVREFVHKLAFGEHSRIGLNGRPKGRTDEAQRVRGAVVTDLPICPDTEEDVDDCHCVDVRDYDEDDEADLRRKCEQEERD
jgi:hypothetical protein